MNTTAQRPDVCSSLKLDWLFFVLTILVVLIPFVGCLGNAFAYFILSKTHSLPTNVTFLLKNSAFALSALALATCIRGLVGVYIYFVDFIVVTRFQCALLELPSNTLVFAFTMAISTVGLDRLASTIRETRYIDVDNKPSRFAYAMLACAWILPAVLQAVILVVSFYDPFIETRMCYCSGLLAAPRSFLFTMAPFCIVLECSMLACYVYVYMESRSSYLDFSINTTQHSLAHRYQMMSNIRTTVLLMPSVIVHGVIYAVMIVACTILALSVEDGSESVFAINCIHVVFVVGALEGVSHPILLLARHEHILKASAKYLPFLERFVRRDLAKANRPSAVPMVGGGGSSSKNPRPSALRSTEAFAQKNRRLAILPKSNKISPGGVVDFRMRPERNEDILMGIWATKPGRAR